MMIATGAFGPPSGDDNVPPRLPDGPSMLTCVSAAIAPAVAATTAANPSATSLMTRGPFEPPEYVKSVGHHHVRRKRPRRLPRRRGIVVACARASACQWCIPMEDEHARPDGHCPHRCSGGRFVAVGPRPDRRLCQVPRFLRPV